MCKILFQNGSSLILDFLVHFCIVLAILSNQQLSLLDWYFIFSNFFFFYIQLTAADKGVQDLNVSKVNAKELSGLKNIKGVENRGVGDIARAE